MASSEDFIVHPNGMVKKVVFKMVPKVERRDYPDCTLAVVHYLPAGLRIELVHPTTNDGDHVDVIAIIGRDGSRQLRRYSGFERISAEDIMDTQLWPDGLQNLLQTIGAVRYHCGHA